MIYKVNYQQMTILTFLDKGPKGTEEILVFWLENYYYQNYQQPTRNTILAN